MYQEFRRALRVQCAKKDKRTIPKRQDHITISKSNLQIYKSKSNTELKKSFITRLVATNVAAQGHSKAFNPFQPEAHIYVPFSCYVILIHYLPITLSYDRQIFMRDSGIAVLHIYSVCTVIECTVVSIYYLKYQCWSQNIKTANFEKANFIKQNCLTKSTYK